MLLKPHIRPASGVTLGQALVAWLAPASGQTATRRAQQVRRLLAEPAEVASLLPPLLRTLHAAGLGVDYELLSETLERWPRPGTRRLLERQVFGVPDPDPERVPLHVPVVAPDVARLVQAAPGCPVRYLEDAVRCYARQYGPAGRAPRRQLTPPA